MLFPAESWDKTEHADSFQKNIPYLYDYIRRRQSATAGLIANRARRRMPVVEAGAVYGPVGLPAFADRRDSLSAAREQEQCSLPAPTAAQTHCAKAQAVWHSKSTLTILQIALPFGPGNESPVWPGLAQPAYGIYLNKRAIVSPSLEIIELLYRSEEPWSHPCVSRVRLGGVGERERL